MVDMQMTVSGIKAPLLDERNIAHAFTIDQ